jgi:hypothetical protein
VNGEEECDDGNDDITDGCLADCSLALNCPDIKAYDDAAPTGVYAIDPDGVEDGESYDVYCEMTIDGGGWQLISVRLSDSDTLFADPLCLAVDANCSGHIPVGQLAGPPEVLVAPTVGDYWLTLTGFSDPGADGFTDMFTLARGLTNTDSCAYPNYCGSNAPLDPDLAVGSHSNNFTPRHMAFGSQAMRYGGFWLGNGGGGPVNHALSMNYGSACGSDGGLDLSGANGMAVGDVQCGADGALYFR